MLSLLLLVASPFPVAVSADLVGQLTPSRCQAEAEAPLVRLAAQLAAAPADAVRLDAGDLLGTSAIASVAIERDLSAVVEAIASLGYRGLGIGHRDLAAPRPRLIAIAQALRDRGLPYTLSNLRCDDDARELCDAVIDAEDPPQLIDGKVAFVTAVAPSALEHAARDRTKGVTLLGPALAIAEAVKRAKEAGAEWVIAAYDPHIGSELEDAIAVALKIDPRASPDVIFVQGVSDRIRAASTAIGNTTLVATRHDQALLAELVRDDDPKIVPLGRGEAAARAVELSRELTTMLCRDYAFAFPGGSLTAPLDREGFTALLLDVLRERTVSEIAVINRLAIARRAPYPFTTALSPLALMQAMPFENELRRTTLRGDALLELMTGKTGALYLVRGMERRGDAWFVNGRPLDPRATYRVVTTDYVADGGVFKKARFDVLSGLTARGVLTEFLAIPRDGDVRTAPIDPSERTRWTLSYRLQLDFTNVNVINPDPAIFTDTQLARGQALSLVGETEFRAFGDHPGFTFENQVRLRYGLLSTVSAAGVASGLIDNIDIVSGRSLFFYRRLFSRKPEWFHPRPYADVYMESELTRPATRRYHHLLLQPTAGVRFELAPPFALYAGVGLTWETMARASELVPPAQPLAFVLVAGWQLRPWKLVQLGERAVELETNLDAFIRDLGADTQATLRGRVRLSVPVFSIISLTATYDMFLRIVTVQNAARVGYSGDIYIGVQVAYSQALQAFSL